MAQINHKVVALHTIVRTLEPGVAGTKDTPAKKPKVQTIEPGTVFVITDQTEFDDLTAAKSISLDIPKAAFVAAPAPIDDGPGVPVVKEDDTPFASDAERAEWVERGKKVDLNVGDNWKPATVRRKVTEAEAAAAQTVASDSQQPAGTAIADLV